MSEWKEYSVKELVELKMLEKPLDGNHGGIHPKASDYVKSGVPFVMANDLKNGKIDYYSCNYITEEQAKTLKKGFARTGDVLLTHKATMGRTAIVDDRYPYVVLTPQVTYYRSKRGIYNGYLKYYFDSKEFQNILSNWSGAGTTRAYLGITEQLKLPIKLPTIEEQKAITDILSSIDDIIELNNRTAKVLEEMSQALYKNWFVNFEFPNEEGKPYKLSGGEMVESENGLIPKGWKIAQLGDVTTNLREKTKSNFYKVLSAVNTGDLMLSEEYFTKQVFSKDLSKYIIVKQKDFAYNPARINIGSIGMNEFDFDGCVSPVYVAFRAEEGYQWFFHVYTKSDNFNNEVNKRASGSVRQALNYSDFALIKIAYPPKRVTDKFNEFYEESYLSQKEIKQETETLINLRDTLLPKLMSGEIRVPFKEEN